MIDTANQDPGEESAIAQRARRLVRGRFLQEAESPGAEAEIEAELGPKLQKIAGRDGPVMERLRELASQASRLWQQRDKLNGKQIALLGAGILYFISPLDAVADVIPLLGYVDDVAVLTWILTQLLPAVDKLRDTVVVAKDAAVDEFSEQIVQKGRVALNELIDERADELVQQFERSSEETVQKAVTALVLGLWGTSLAAAISLALTTLAGSYTPQWATYILITSAVVVSWNMAWALSLLRRYRALDGGWQYRFKTVLGAQLTRRRHVLMVALPGLLIIGLAVAHAFAT